MIGHYCPCLYYGTEQQLHGAGSDELVREALWGKVPDPPSPFDETNPFYTAIQRIAEVRARQPALGYGRQYFRQISGDGQTFGVSTLTPGVLAFSRLLNDEEVLIVANITTAPVAVFVIVDAILHPVGSRFVVAFSNRTGAVQPQKVAELGANGSLTIQELDGSISRGPAHAVRVSLAGREAQILTKPL